MNWLASAQLASRISLKKMISEEKVSIVWLLGVAITKVVSIPLACLAVITLTDVREVLQIVLMIVSIICPILVTRSTLRKNAAEIPKAKGPSSNVLAWGGAVLALFLMTGCASLVPTERHQSQSVKTTEAIATASEKTIERSLEVVPQMAIAISTNMAPSGFPQQFAIAGGPAITERVKVTSRTDSGAGSKDNASGSSTVEIPLWVSLIGFSVGLILLLVAVNAWRKSSVAADQAFKTGDKALAGVIGHVESWAQEATEPQTLAKLNSLLSTANKERGKLRASTK